MEEKEFIPDPEAAQLGVWAAMQTVLKALIVEHHDPIALVQRMRVEREKMLVQLMNGPAREAAIDVFQAAMGDLMPEVTKHGKPV